MALTSKLEVLRWVSCIVSAAILCNSVSMVKVRLLNTLSVETTPLSSYSSVYAVVLFLFTQRFFFKKSQLKTAKVQVTRDGSTKSA